MPWRLYPKKTYRDLKDGTRRYYQTFSRKWINSNRRYRPQKRGLEKRAIYSKRFGLLELYNRKEQQQLFCPSGYSVSQCFNVLSKLWHGYHRARLGNEGIEKIEKYARAIQGVQRDMGIRTTSFPHLGIYGDVFILNDKIGQRILFEDHSAMKKKQEEYEKCQAENSIEIQQHVQEPDIEKGEEIESFADDIYPFKKMEPEEDEEVPDMLEPDEEEGEEEIVLTDDIPFKSKNKN